MRPAPRRRAMLLNIRHELCTCILSGQFSGQRLCICVFVAKCDWGEKPAFRHGLCTCTLAAHDLGRMSRQRLCTSTFNAQGLRERWGNACARAVSLPLFSASAYANLTIVTIHAFQGINVCCLLAFSLPIAFRGLKMAPREGQRARRGAQYGPKTVPRVPQSAPRAPQQWV